MKIFDITVTIDPDLPVWPGDPKVVISRSQKLEAGDNANVSQLAMGVHTGTHVDAPHHFLKEGILLDQIALERFIGPASVVEFPPDVEILTQAVLASIAGTQISERTLFKTRNSGYWAERPHRFHPNFVGIDASGAQYLVERGVRLVGIDYLSIGPFGNGKATHEVLLGAGIVILEGVDLSGVQAGKYQLYCLPLKLGGVEGAPVRAILMDV